MCKWKICNAEITDWLHFAINVRKSHRQPQCTLQLLREDRVLFVWGELQLSLCLQQHPKYERAIRLVYPPLICKLRSSSNPTNKYLSQACKFKHLYLDNRTNIFLTMTKTVTSQIIDHSLWITLYSVFQGSSTHGPRAVVSKLLVWCGAEGYVSGLQDAGKPASCKPDT